MTRQAQVTRELGIELGTRVRVTNFEFKRHPKGDLSFRIEKAGEQWETSGRGMMVFCKKPVPSDVREFEIVGFPFQGLYAFAEPCEG